MPGSYELKYLEDKYYAEYNRLTDYFDYAIN